MAQYAAELERAQAAPLPDEEDADLVRFLFFPSYRLSLYIDVAGATQ